MVNDFVEAKEVHHHLTTRDFNKEILNELRHDHPNSYNDIVVAAQV